jgi:two-component system chemotaxis sensor kinase CheA
VALSPADYHVIAEEGRFLFRGKYLNPMVDLKRALGRTGGTESVPPDHGYIVVIGEPERRAGLLVDNVLRQHEVVIKPLGRYLSRFAPADFSGATIMGDGTIELILNTGRLIDKIRKREMEKQAV